MSLKTKSEIAKSELWMNLIAAAGAVVSAIYASKPGASTWINTMILIVMAAVYAFARTPVAADKSGWKTKQFWGALAVVLASCATAVTEADIPGLPAGATKIAAVLVAALAAVGYTAVRFKAKKATAKAALPPA